VHSLLGAYQPLCHLLHPFCRWTQWPTRLTAVSRAACRIMRRLSGKRDVTVLPNGIDPDEWKIDTGADDSTRAEVRVTSVIRLNIKKCPQALLRAIPDVCRRLPSAHQPRFTLIGDGPCRARLMRQAERTGISDRVEFLGTLSRPAIREVFRHSDLFVLPTRNEAFGIAALEARAAGLPVVAMSGCGVSDLVEHGVQGLLAGNQPELVQHLVRLIADVELRRALAQRARLGVEQFDWDHVVQKHLNEYARAIAQRSFDAPRERKFAPTRIDRAGATG
jgi:glycosyltransferase involved in cell wall biosynthesis